MIDAICGSPESADCDQDSMEEDSAAATTPVSTPSTLHWLQAQCMERDARVLSLSTRHPMPNYSAEFVQAHNPVSARTHARRWIYALRHKHVHMWIYTYWASTLCIMCIYILNTKNLNYRAQLGVWIIHISIFTRPREMPCVCVCMYNVRCARLIRAYPCVCRVCVYI